MPGWSPSEGVQIRVCWGSRFESGSFKLVKTEQGEEQRRLAEKTLLAKVTTTVTLGGCVVHQLPNEDGSTPGVLHNGSTVSNTQEAKGFQQTGIQNRTVSENNRSGRPEVLVWPPTQAADSLNETVGKNT